MSFQKLPNLKELAEDIRKSANEELQKKETEWGRSIREAKEKREDLLKNPLDDTNNFREGAIETAANEAYYKEEYDDTETAFEAGFEAGIKWYLEWKEKKV